jgi:hypothetical protein
MAEVTSLKLLYGAICIVFIFLSNYMVEMIGRWHFAHGGNKHPFDLLHLALPDLHKYKWLANVLPIGLLGFVLMQSNGAIIFKESILFLVMILLLRALTTISTILPKHEKCVEPDTVSLFLGNGCYDKIFSGHMSFVTIFSLVLLGHKNISTLAFAAINLLQATLILLGRSHYTVDVILGFLLTYLIYDGDYHIFTDFFKGIGSSSSK